MVRGKWTQTNVFIHWSHIHGYPLTPGVTMSVIYTGAYSHYSTAPAENIKSFLGGGIYGDSNVYHVVISYKDWRRGVLSGAYVGDNVRVVVHCKASDLEEMHLRLLMDDFGVDVIMIDPVVATFATLKDMYVRSGFLPKPIWLFGFKFMAHPSGMIKLNEYGVTRVLTPMAANAAIEGMVLRASPGDGLIYSGFSTLELGYENPLKDSSELLWTYNRFVIECFTEGLQPKGLDGFIENSVDY